MQAYWEGEGIAPVILKLGTKWRIMVSFNPEQSPQYLVEDGWAPELFSMLCRTGKSLASGGVNY